MSEALITALVALIDSRIDNRLNGHAAAAAQQPVQPVQPVAQPDPFAGLGGAPVAAAQPEVTPMMIQELIVPMLPDENKKARLAAAMQQLGISELPAARPDQLPALYAAFKAIADETAGASTPAASGGVTLI